MPCRSGTDLSHHAQRGMLLLAIWRFFNGLAGIIVLPLPVVFHNSADVFSACL